MVEDSTQPWVKKEKDKRDIELYIARLFDLRYLSYSYTLDYTTIDIKGDKATVQLYESHSVVFESLAPDVSKLFDLQHTFTLHNKKGMWVIYKDVYQDELSQELNYLTKVDILKQVDRNYQEDLKQKASITIGSGKGLANLLARPLSLTTYWYNRGVAVTYADSHVPEPPCGSPCGYNTDYYKTEPGTDCANFVSQAMYAGEGKSPPDTSGMTTAPGRSYSTDWYYVFNSPVGQQNGSGSSPWIQVIPQYTFLTGNTNKIGPFGVLSSFSSTSQADIVQINTDNTNYNHEGIIVYKGTSLSTTSIDAHTANRYHYALSNWASFPMRFIHIQGWRGN